MRRRVKWVLLLALLACLIAGVAAAETGYDALCRQHGIRGSDVIAWLEIPGAGLVQPVMRHPTDDAYYATHDATGRESASGAVYAQATYSAADFSDPVTVVYGTSVTEEAPFGRMQEMYSGSFEACAVMYLHLPQETRTYTAFAAVPYSATHILHYYDFRLERRYRSFFDSVFSTRALGMHLDENNRPEAGRDQVLILSTALRGDSLQRYLVMARRDIP